ncbi:MAG: PASTA domain-containing protein [Flavobacteriales bacterium]|nr:PASTA domain-containing protein [Flavobacteriales bacterium]
MFKFFLSKKFLINLAAAIVFIVIVIWSIFKYIDSYTLHGQSTSVPSLEGLTVAEVEKILEEKKLRYTILDSIYLEKADKGVVLDQNPLPDELVKEGRNIYITVSRVIPPSIAMPDVVEMSQRLAIAKLESYGLKVKTEYIPSEFVNSVIMQKVNGKEVKPNQKVKLGTTVLLSIGSASDEKVLVPYLIDLTKEEARHRIFESSLNVGIEDYTDCKCVTPEDTLNARIYRQSPVRSSSVPVTMGTSIDLYFTCDTSLIHANEPDSTANTPNE